MTLSNTVAVERIVLEQVVEKTKSKYDEVLIYRSLLVFVPKWSATIQSKNKDKSYTNQGLGASKTILCEEIKLQSSQTLYLSMAGNALTSLI